MEIDPNEHDQHDPATMADQDAEPAETAELITHDEQRDQADDEGR